METTHSFLGEFNKKLSCRRETARASSLVPLNISLSHSRSFKVVWNDTIEYGVCTPYSYVIVTICISHLSEIFSVK